MLTAERLREVMKYEPATGLFIRIAVRRGMAKRTLGEVAGHVNNQGYVLMEIDGRRYQAHRLAWLYEHGSWPRHEIDHINGVRDDNRIVNLRDVPRSFNQQNLRSSMPKRSRPAPLGVSWHRQAGRWRAMIWNGSKNIYLGLFDDANEAHQAYLEEKRRLHPGCTI